MYDPPCSHGYVNGSCAECRASRFDRETILDQYLDQYRGMARPELDAARDRCVTRTAELESYTRRSQAQSDELGGLIAEGIAIDDAIKRSDVEIRRSQIEKIKRTAMDPANLEAGWDQGQGHPDFAPACSAPAYVKGQLGTRIESAAETISRANPWRDPDRGPLVRETSAGFVARANTCIETVSERLGHDGAELLSSLLSERRESRGVSVRRSQDEIRQGAEMIVALSSPFYESAMRAVFRNPDLFRTGIGAMVWSDDERDAVHAVMNNTLVRAAFAETSGATGAYALPLQLSPEILFVNAGVSSPHRQLARHELATSNTWNGITSQGATSSFVAEATAVADSTPAIGQLVITPYAIKTWVMGSWESLDDTDLSSQVPAIFDDARSRLEGSVFAIGTGSAQPFGVVTRAGPDTTAGVITAAMIYALDQNLPPRFRNGGKVAWAANESIRNACRQIPPFTGATADAIAKDDGTGQLRMLGYPFYESSTMLGGTTGNRELLLGDWQSMVIVDRLPNVTLAEPLLMSQATALPTGQRGWLNWSRTGSDTVTQGAAFGSNAFVVHVH